MITRVDDAHERREKMRCKFYVSEVAQTAGAGQAPSGEILKMQAVIGTAGDNADWSKWTPSGSMSLHVTNPDAVGRFKAGQIVYIDIAPVEG